MWRSVSAETRFESRATAGEVRAPDAAATTGLACRRDGPRPFREVAECLSEITFAHTDDAVREELAWAKCDHHSGCPEVTIAIWTSRQSCAKAEKPQISGATSGAIPGIPDKCSLMTLSSVAGASAVTNPIQYPRR
jgi:hypothetical protein